MRRVHALLAKRVARNTALLRKKRKLSQATLAGRLGVSQAYLSMLESGERESPSLEMIEKLATAFGVPPTHMFKE